MKVSLVTETYFPQVNGVSRTLDRLVPPLVGAGHDVQIIMPRQHGGNPKVPLGATVAAFPSFPLPLYAEIRLAATGPVGVADQFVRFRPDVVHIATEGPLGLAALRTTKRLRLPALSSYHTNFADYLRFYGFGFLERAAWAYLRRFHNATEATFCPTDSVRADLGGRGFRSLWTWSRGVDSQLFHPLRRDPEWRRGLGVADEEVVFLYVGRLAAEKNLPMLIEACRRLPASLAWRLLLVGDGPLRPPLEAGPDPRVMRTGYLHGTDLARAYASSDVFAFPSLTETFGNVMLEAMAAGLPVVGFEVPGPRDVIQDGRTGVLAPNVGAASLAQALHRLATDSALREATAAEARTYAESQSWDRVNAVVSGRYEALARGRACGDRPSIPAWNGTARPT